MLVRLLPEQISFRWNIIKEAIAGASPPYAGISQEAMNNTLMSLLNGSLQCWISVVDGKVDAILTTCIEEDIHSKTRNLLIYSLYGMRKISGRSWIEGFEALKKYALGERCEAIIAITKEDVVVKVFEKLGGSVKWRYLRASIDPTI